MDKQTLLLFWTLFIGMCVFLLSPDLRLAVYIYLDYTYVVTKTINWLILNSYVCWFYVIPIMASSSVIKWACSLGLVVAASFKYGIRNRVV